ncbi:MAG: glutamyl-tRNA synthetase [Planctomycetota bacterium]|jgi:glutamyl-tRNA synthetase
MNLPAPTLPNDAPALVGRLAPSPTGDLHIGHARSFLLAWWSIRSRGGRMLLRMEDLDRERVKPGSIDGVLRDLEWLGLDWDGPMHLQSETEEHLHAAVQQLVDGGFAFPCFCTRKEISLSAPHITDGERKYAGTCRDRFASEAEGEAQLQRVAGLRFRCDPQELKLHDAFLGDFTSNPGQEVGDYLIRRRDGAIAYQLSVVVDDARSGVTEVLRGQDLLSSCARQWLLQEALELPHPSWVHVPLVVDSEARRLAKRDGDTTLVSLRESGMDPRKLVTWVARSAGMECDDLSTASELTPLFDLARIPKSDVTIRDAHSI